MSNLYQYKTGSRGLDKESAQAAAEDVSKPVIKRHRVRAGGEGPPQRLIISCPVKGTVHSPITWFLLPDSMDVVANFTKMALSPETFSLVGKPSHGILMITADTLR